MFLFRQASFYVAIVGLILVGTLVATFAARKPPGPAAAAPPAKPFERGLGATGIVEALNENTVVGVPVSGVVEKVFVNVWRRVAAGEPLLELDGRELRAQLPVREAETQVAKAKLERLQDQLDRMEKLRASRVASDEEYRARRFDVAVATAELAGARAAVEQVRELLERLIVRAPVAGTVLRCDVRAGEFLSVGTTSSPLVLGDIDTLQVRADVDEQVAHRVRPGSPAVGYVKGVADRPIPLKFTRIEPFIQPKQSLTGLSTERVDTRVLRVIYHFTPDDPAHPVYVGQQLDVYIQEGLPGDPPILP